MSSWDKILLFACWTWLWRETSNFTSYSTSSRLTVTPWLSNVWVKSSQKYLMILFARTQAYNSTEYQKWNFKFSTETGPVKFFHLIASLNFVRIYKFPIVCFTGFTWCTCCKYNVLSVFISTPILPPESEKKFLGCFGQEREFFRRFFMDHRALKTSLCAAGPARWDFMQLN